MGVFFDPDTAEQQAVAQNQPPERPAGLEQYAMGGNQKAQPLTQVADRAQTQFPLMGKDGKQETQGPVEDVKNFDQNGNQTGTSHYVYADYQPNGVKLNGYIDKDAQGNVKEFAVRLPASHKDQKDVFMVFRFPPPGSQQEEQQREAQMTRVFALNRTDLPPEQRAANLKEFNKERPLPGNLVNNFGDQIENIVLDPQTGQRYTIRDLRNDPKTGAVISSRQNQIICWQARDPDTGGISNFMYPVANLPDREKTDIANAGFHSNLRTPLYFLRQPARQQAAQPPQPTPG